MGAFSEDYSVAYDMIPAGGQYASTAPLLASPADLALWFDGVDASDPKLIAALDEASNRFRGAVRHFVSRRTVTAVLDGRGQRYLSLPVIELDTTSVLVSLSGATDPVPVQASTSGIIALADGGAFPDGLGNVTVTYTAGFAQDAIPPEIQAVVLDQAKVLYALKRGIQWLAVGGISMSVNANDANGVTQAWSDVVALYRIRTGDRA